MCFIFPFVELVDYYASALSEGAEISHYCYY